MRWAETHLMRAYITNWMESCTFRIEFLRASEDLRQLYRLHRSLGATLSHNYALYECASKGLQRLSRLFLKIELVDEYETGKAARLQRYEASCSHSIIAFFIVETKTMQPCKILAPYDILDRRIAIPELLQITISECCCRDPFNVCRPNELP